MRWVTLETLLAASLAEGVVDGGPRVSADSDSACLTALVGWSSLTDGDSVNLVSNLSATIFVALVVASVLRRVGS